MAAELNREFPASRTLPMQEYVSQTLGYVTETLRTAAMIAFLFAIGVTALISTLFIQLRLARDRSTMAVLHALGFTHRDIAAQVLFKTGVCAALGTAVGVLLTATVGQWFVGSSLAFAGLGLRGIAFLDNVLLAYVAAPLCLLIVGCMGAVLLVRRLRSVDKNGWLREE